VVIKIISHLAHEMISVCQQTGASLKVFTRGFMFYYFLYISYFFAIYLTIFSQFIVIVSGDLNYGPDGNAAFGMGRTSFWRTCLVSFITLLKQNNPSTKNIKLFLLFLLLLLFACFFVRLAFAFLCYFFFYFFISQTTVGVM